MNRHNEYFGMGCIVIACLIIVGIATLAPKSNAVQNVDQVKVMTTTGDTAIITNKKGTILIELKTKKK